MSVAARILLAAALLTSTTACRTRGGTTAGLVSAVTWVGAAALYANASPEHRDDREVVVPGVMLVTVGSYALLAAVILGSQPRAESASESYVGGAYDGGNSSYAASDGSDGSDGVVTGSTRAPSYGARGAADVSCSFGSCQTYGSSGRTASGASVETRCSFGDCDKHGWTTTVDGKSSESRCSFGDCAKNGWSTTEADGSTSDTRCSFGDCSSNGWTTTTPEGTFESRCSFGDCNKYGWTTTGSDGSSVECRCKFGDCDANGVECH